MQSALRRRYGHMAPSGREGQFHWHFFSADCKEPPNVDITYRESRLKVWLDKHDAPEPVWPAFDINNKDDKARILAYAKRNREMLLKKWRAHRAKLGD